MIHSDDFIKEVGKATKIECLGVGEAGLAVIHTTELTLAYYDSEHSNFTLLAGK